MAVQRGRSKRRCEAYSLRYAESLSAARTKLADFFSILLSTLHLFRSIAMLLLRLEKMRYAMSEYHIGGGLRLLTALEKTEQFAAFLKTRMTPALETQDPTELHYLLAQLDDFHSYMWRYYKKLAAERPHRMNPDL